MSTIIENILFSRDFFDFLPGATVEGVSTLSAAIRAVLAEDAAKAFPENRLRAAVRAVAEEDPATAANVLSVFDGAQLPDIPEPTSPGTNATATWISANYREIHRSLTTYLTSKMPQSRKLSVIEDHISAFLSRLIERDTFAAVLAAEGTVKLSILRVWAYQNACTELRRWGSDASLRVTRGARTSREVKQGKEFRVVQSTETVREVVLDSDHSDLHDPEAVSPEDVFNRKSRIEEVRRSLIRRGLPEMIPVVQGLIEGQTLPELHAAFGYSPKQILSALKDCRAVA